VQLTLLPLRYLLQGKLTECGLYHFAYLYPLNVRIATALSHTRDRILEVFKEKQGFTTQLLRTHAMSWLLSTMASAWHGKVL